MLTNDCEHDLTTTLQESRKIVAIIRRLVIDSYLGFQDVIVFRDLFFYLILSNCLQSPDLFIHSFIYSFIHLLFTYLFIIYLFIIYLFIYLLFTYLFI